MKLTTQQVTSLFHIVQEAGFGHHLEFEILTQDDYGNVIVGVTSDTGAQRWKLAPKGGRELLS